MPWIPRLLSIVVATVLVAACGGGSSGGGGGGGNPAPAPPMFEGMNVVNFPMAATVPANASSPYAGQLRDCVFSNTRSESCTLGTLPLLGTQTRNPSIDDVMNRVLISHGWMGTRFREILEELPAEMLLLMRGVTAVVISSDVRPSFYWTRTGAIYLDPDYIWLTPAERATIPDTPDFRSDFGRDLQFAMPWRYVKDNAPAYFRPPFGQETTRTIDDMIVDIARLLFHELAHANDYYPPERQANLSPSRTPGNSIISPIVSDDLTTQLPLGSAVMRGLARVRFHGDTATSAQRALTPDDVAGHFSPDVAPVFYSYSTTREDLAMLFEILVMRFHFGVEMDTAVTNNPSGPGLTGADYIVAWGQRNRIGVPAILERARYVVSRIMPEADVDAYVDGVPGPRQMRAGESWADNLVLDPDATPQGLATTLRFDPRDLPVEELPGYQ